LFACKYFSLILELLRYDVHRITFLFFVGLASPLSNDGEDLMERKESATPLPASKGLDLFVPPALPVDSPEDFFFTVP